MGVARIRAASKCNVITQPASCARVESSLAAILIVTRGAATRSTSLDAAKSISDRTVTKSQLLNRWNIWCPCQPAELYHIELAGASQGMKAAATSQRYFKLALVRVKSKPSPLTPDKTSEQ